MTKTYTRPTISYCYDCEERRTVKQKTKEAITYIVTYAQCAFEILAGITIAGVFGFGIMVLAVKSGNPAATALAIGIFATSITATWQFSQIVQAYKNKEI